MSYTNFAELVKFCKTNKFTFTQADIHIKEALKQDIINLDELMKITREYNDLIKPDPTYNSLLEELSVLKDDKSDFPKALGMLKTVISLIEKEYGFDLGLYSFQNPSYNDNELLRALVKLGKFMPTAERKTKKSNTSAVDFHEYLKENPTTVTLTQEQLLDCLDQIEDEEVPEVTVEENVEEEKVHKLVTVQYSDDPTKSKNGKGKNLVEV